MTNDNESGGESIIEDPDLAQNKTSEEDDYLVTDRARIEAQRENESAFKEAVAILKSEHGGSLMMLNLMTDPAVARAVSAWPSVPRSITEDSASFKDPWNMIWFAPGLWMDAARIPRELEASIMLTIRQNHLVYPDGTMPPQVQAYLVQRGRDLLGLPAPTRPEPPTHEDGGPGEGG